MRKLTIAAFAALLFISPAYAQDALKIPPTAYTAPNVNDANVRLDPVPEKHGGKYQTGLVIGGVVLSVLIIGAIAGKGHGVSYASIGPGIAPVLKK